MTPNQEQFMTDVLATLEASAEGAPLDVLQGEDPTAGIDLTGVSAFPEEEPAFEPQGESAVEVPQGEAPVEGGEPEPAEEAPAAEVVPTEGEPADSAEETPAAESPATEPSVEDMEKELAELKAQLAELEGDKPSEGENKEAMNKQADSFMMNLADAHSDITSLIPQVFGPIHGLETLQATNGELIAYDAKHDEFRPTNEESPLTTRLYNLVGQHGQKVTSAMQ